MTINAHANANPETSRTVASGRGNTLGAYASHVLIRTRRNTAIWTISLAAYSALIVSIFSSVQGAMDVSQYPEAMREAFDITSLDEIEPYLTSQIFSYLPLVLSFLPILMFAGAIAGAEEQGSLDVLLGTPLPRPHLVLSNVAAAIVNLSIVLTALALANWGVSLAVDAGLSLRDSVAASVATLPPVLFMGSVALALAGQAARRGLVVGVSVGIMFAMYALQIVSQLVDGMGWLKWLSVFHYYGKAIEDGVYWVGAGVLLGLSALLIALAVSRFNRRDIYA